MKPVLGIVDRETKYAKRLADALNERADFPYEAVLSETWDDLLAYRALHPVELVLADQAPPDPGRAYGLRVFLFSEEPGAGNRICRYQPIPALTEEIRRKAESADTKAEEYRSGPAGFPAEAGHPPVSEESGDLESGGENLRQRLYRKLMQGLSLSEEISDEELYRRIDRILIEEAETEGLFGGARVQQRELLFSTVRRYDALSLALRDPLVTEVMINGPDRIFIEKEGWIEAFPEHFLSEQKLLDVVQRIASSVNRRISEATPMADAMLPDGLRVNLVLPPIAPDGPVVTVRRFPKNPIAMTDLVRIGSISEEAAEFLQVLVSCGYNLFISGGTGAGKTTFLGALASLIPPEERVITIEDSLELQIQNLQNLVRLQTRPANLEGEYEVTIRQLIRNALRMRPNRIIVGEIRGEEALDMLQAMNTGHDGSLSTGHANSAEDMIRRIETMVLMGAEKLPLRAIRSQIASAIDIMIHLDRIRDRSRRVSGIYEVRGIRDEEVRLAPLFVFRETGERDGKVEGRLVRTEEALEFVGKLEKHGARLPEVPAERSGNPESFGGRDGGDSDPFLAVF